MKNKIIYLSRHGESEYNVKQLIGGDSKLTNNGLKYSKKIYQYFKNKNVHVWTSKLKRTIQTAQYFKDTKH